MQYHDPIWRPMRETFIPSIRASSPFPMVTKFGIYNVDNAGTEFSAKNGQKNDLMGIFAPIFTLRPIRGQDFN